MNLKYLRMILNFNRRCMAITSMILMAFSIYFILRMNTENFIRIEVNNLLMKLTGGRPKICNDMFITGNFDQKKHIWQPSKCRMHYYNKSEIQECMNKAWGKNGENYFVFIGDSRVKRLFLWVISLVSRKRPSYQDHTDASFSDPTVNYKSDFKWREGIDEKLYDDIDKYLQLPVDKQPKIIVISEGVHTILREFDNTDGYAKNLSKLGDQLGLFKKSAIFWILQQRVNERVHRVFNRPITNQRIVNINLAAMESLKDKHLTIWKSSREVTLNHHHDYYDAVHRGPFALQTDSQMLLNFYCNNIVENVNATCCMQ